MSSEQVHLLEGPLRDLLRVFTYRPGWTFEVDAGQLHIRAEVVDTDDVRRTCVITDRRALPLHSLRSGHVDDKFWMQWLREAILSVERHEMDEFFKVGGVKVFDPHYNG